MLDAGHGGKDPGASANGLVEKVLTLRLVKAVKLRCEQAGINAQIRLTRSSDTYLSLSQRAKMANDWGADYFISHHFNAGGGTGLEAYGFITPSRKRDEMNKKYYNHFVKQMNYRDRGLKRANFAVLRETRMPALLVENLFLDNSADAKFLKSDAGFEKLVSSHVSAMLHLTGKTRPQTTKGMGNFSYLSSGSRGNDVRILQISLNTFGHNAGAVDGIFGPQTDKALRSFQRASKIKVDGSFGPETLNAMLYRTP